MDLKRTWIVSFSSFVIKNRTYYKIELLKFNNLNYIWFHRAAPFGVHAVSTGYRYSCVRLLTATAVISIPVAFLDQNVSSDHL